jgi:hypothetical protein
MPECRIQGAPLKGEERSGPQNSQPQSLCKHTLSFATVRPPFTTGWSNYRQRCHQGRRQDAR